MTTWILIITILMGDTATVRHIPFHRLDDCQIAGDMFFRSFVADWRNQHPRAVTFTLCVPNSQQEP